MGCSLGISNIHTKLTETTAANFKDQLKESGINSSYQNIDLPPDPQSSLKVPNGFGEVASICNE